MRREGSWEVSEEASEEEEAFVPDRGEEMRRRDVRIF